MTTLELPLLAADALAAEALQRDDVVALGGLVAQYGDQLRLIQMSAIVRKARQIDDPRASFRLWDVDGQALASSSQVLGTQGRPAGPMQAGPTWLGANGRTLIQVLQDPQYQFQLRRTVYRCSAGGEEFSAADFVVLKEQCPEHHAKIDEQ